jgi:hypothetical protein
VEHTFATDGEDSLLRCLQHWFYDNENNAFCNGKSHPTASSSKQHQQYKLQEYSKLLDETII